MVMMPSAQLNASATTAAPWDVEGVPMVAGLHPPVWIFWYINAAPL